MFLSAVLLTGVVDSSLLATGVSISTRLQGTATGQRVVDIYKGLVGKNVRFCYSESSSGELNYYTGEIAAVILPDIADFIASGEQLPPSHEMAGQLKLEITAAQAKDLQAAGEELPNLIDARGVEYYSSYGIIPNNLKEIISGSLGEKISWVRLLAEHWEQGEELRWEVLVEMESDGDTYVELEEPFIATLARSEFKEDVFPQAIGSDFAGFASSHSTSDDDLYLLLLAAKTGDTAEVVRLHENGAKLEARDSYKQTPLMYAAMSGKAETAERLLELGADSKE